MIASLVWILFFHFKESKLFTGITIDIGRYNFVDTVFPALLISLLVYYVCHTQRKSVSQDEIDKYNSNKTCYQIFPRLLWRVQTVEDFLNVDQDLKEYDDLSRHMDGIGWEVRKRVSKDGCRFLYCFVRPSKDTLNSLRILHHHTSGRRYLIDFKFFKEEDEPHPPSEMLESEERFGIGERKV